MFDLSSNVTNPRPSARDFSSIRLFFSYLNSWLKNSGSWCITFGFLLESPSVCYSPLTFLFFTSLSSLSPSSLFPSKSFIPRLIQEWNGAQARLVNGVLWAIRLLSHLRSFLWIFLREATEITNPTISQSYRRTVWTGCGFHQLCTFGVKHQQALHLSDILCSASLWDRLTHVNKRTQFRFPKQFNWKWNKDGEAFCLPFLSGNHRLYWFVDLFISFLLTFFSPFLWVLCVLGFVTLITHAPPVTRLV